MAEDAVDELAQSAGHLDSRGATTDDNDPELDRRLSGRWLDSNWCSRWAQSQRVSCNVFSGKRVGLDTLDSERSADRPGGDHEVVVVERSAIANRDR